MLSLDRLPARTEKNGVGRKLLSKCVKTKQISDQSSPIEVRARAAAVRSQEPRERGRKLSLTVSTAERIVIRPQTFDCAHIEEPLADRVPFEHIDGFKKSSMSPNFVPVAIVDRRFESGGVIYYAVQGPNGEVFWLSTAQCAQLCPGLITYFLYAKVAKLMGFDEMP
jgi:hypothetical protein